MNRLTKKFANLSACIIVSSLATQTAMASEDWPTAQCDYTLLVETENLLSGQVSSKPLLEGHSFGISDRSQSIAELNAKEELSSCIRSYSRHLARDTGDFSLYDCKHVDVDDNDPLSGSYWPSKEAIYDNAEEILRESCERVATTEPHDIKVRIYRTEKSGDCSADVYSEALYNDVQINCE